jgi:ribonuclease HI
MEKQPLQGIAVDGSCYPRNPGICEYRGIDIDTGEVLFHSKRFYASINVAEFLAIVHAQMYLKKHGLPGQTIYSDSTNAIGWAYNKEANCWLEREEYPHVWEMLDKAHAWMKKKKNIKGMSVVWWDKKKWGENPADFGRK